MRCKQWLKDCLKGITPLKILYKYYKKVKRGFQIYLELLHKYGIDTWILICPWPGTGDAYQTGRYLNAFLGKNKIDNFVIVVGNKGVKRVLDIFDVQNVEVRCFDDTEHLSHLLQFIGNEKMKIRLLHHNPPEMYSSMMKSIEGINDYTWGDMFRDIGMGLDKEDACDVGYFTRDLKNIKDYFERNKLTPGHTVIFSPYANTFANISEKTWETLANYLKQLGYCVCTNCDGEKEKPIRGTKQCFFKYKDMISALEYAGCFIGLRSGLCDIASSAKCKKIVIYQPVKCGFGNLIELFHMGKMGLCDDAIEFEYSMEYEKSVIFDVLNNFDDARSLVKELRVMKKEQTCKVSVIVPAYNAEKYLYDCLKSIQVQSLNEIEVLVVDNGSTDKTGEIIDKFAAFDKRFRKINVFPNIGVANARNKAMEQAKGQFIAFCDADDFVPHNAYEKLYHNAMKNDSDVVVGNYYEIIDNTWRNFCNTAESGREFVIFFAGGVVWNKLYRTGFLNRQKIRFRNYNFGEDTLFMGDVYVKSPNVSTESEDIYHHLQRTNISNTTQLTRQYNQKNLMDYFECGNIVYTLPYSCEEGDVYIEYMRYLDYVHHFWWEIPNPTEQKNSFRDLQNFTRLFQYNNGEREADFARIFNLDPKLFQKISYEVYMAYLVNLHNCNNSNQIAIPYLEPRYALLDEFKEGKIGFRFIIKYSIAWLKFKLHGAKVDN